MHFFEGNSGLHQTLTRLRARLDELGIAYAVVGGMALTAHGYARMTEDVDVLVTRPDLAKLHKHLVGRGYTRLFAGSKNIRDVDTRVKIEFVITGDFPGDGKPQPVSFPDPTQTEPIEQDGVKFIGLARLVELKLAAGMTGGPDRAKDLVDVQQLVKISSLPREFAERLHPQVRAKYHELWDGLHATRRKYIRVLRDPFTRDAGSIDELIDGLSGALDELRRMQADGVTLERDAAGERATLVTHDPAIAETYDMHEESEFFVYEDE